MKLPMLYETMGSADPVVFRAGSSEGILLHFGTMAAAQKASIGRDIHRGILKLNSPATMVDSGRSHNINPVALAQDIVAGNNPGITADLIPVIKKILDNKGIKAAFEGIRDALKNHEYDGVAYVNTNEDPGSISYIALDGNQFMKG